MQQLNSLKGEIRLCRPGGHQTRRCLLEMQNLISETFLMTRTVIFPLPQGCQTRRLFTKKHSKDLFTRALLSTTLEFGHGGWET